MCVGLVNDVIELIIYELTMMMMMINDDDDSNDSSDDYDFFISFACLSTPLLFI